MSEYQCVQQNKYYFKSTLGVPLKRSNTLTKMVLNFRDKNKCLNSLYRNFNIRSPGFHILSQYPEMEIKDDCPWYAFEHGGLPNLV